LFLVADKSYAPIYQKSLAIQHSAINSISENASHLLRIQDKKASHLNY